MQPLGALKKLFFVAGTHLEGNWGHCGAECPTGQSTT